MAVGTYCLTTSDAARVYAGNTGQKDAFWIYANSPTGATAATCEVTATGLSLVITGGASAGTDTLAFATYTTLTTLIAAINALVKPAGTFTWKAGLVYYGASPSSYLPMTGAIACLGSANQIRVQTATTYETDLLADKATDLIERWANRKFVGRTYDRRVYDGNGRNRFLLDQYPVTRVGRVSLGRTNCFSVTNTTATNFATVEVSSTNVRLNADGTVNDLTISSSATLDDLITAINAKSGWSATLCNSGDGTKKAYYTSLDGTTKVPEILQMAAHACLSPEVAYVEMPDDDLEGYYLETTASDEDRNPGILYYIGGFTAGHQNLIVDFQAGFSTTPAALEALCLELVKLKYDRMSADLNMKSESQADYAYTVADLRQVSSDLLEEAAFFKSVEF